MDLHDRYLKSAFINPLLISWLQMAKRKKIKEEEKTFIMIMI